MIFARVPTAAAASVFLLAAITLNAPLARAQGTEILSAAPRDAKVLIGTSRLSDLDKNWSSLMAAIDMDGLIPFAPTDAFSQMGLDPAAFDRTRSAGLAVMDFESDGDEPPVLVLLPVSDYAKWAKSFGPDVAIDGVAEVAFPMGGPAFIRSAGKYAVMSPNRALVEAYAPRQGAAEHFGKRLGPVGNGVIERAQVFAIVDFEGLAPMRKQIIESITEAVSDQMAMAGAMGMGLPAADQFARMNEALWSMLFDECSGVVAGLRFGDRGMAVDLAIQTREGSEIGALLPGPERSRNLLAGMEDAPFLMAMSLDYGGLKVGALVDAISKRLGIDQAAGGQPGAMPTAELWRHSDGMSMAVYPSPGGMFAGLLSRSVMMMSGDGEKIVAAFRDMMSALPPTDAGGVTVSAEYTPAAKQIGGISADAYAVRMSGPAEMTAQIQQMQQMMYGPAGLQGYILPVKGGVLQTTSRNTELIEKTLAAMRGEAARLGDNRVLAAVDALFPPNPSLRCYLGLGSISNMVGPFIAMGMPGLDINELKALPPVGMGASVSRGGIVGSLVIPAPVIKTIAEMAQQFAGDLMGGEGEDEEPPLF